MAKQSDLSTSQLQRDFRKLFRMSPGEYIMRLRLQLARRQLINSNEPVGQIASDCGFLTRVILLAPFENILASLLRTIVVGLGSRVLLKNSEWIPSLL